jgi:hypothetical protein
MVRRAEETGAADDREKCRRLAEGLMFLSSVGEVRGFVSRGVATDGKTTYPMGSNDQTGPFCFGLWRYAASGLADAELKRRIVERLVEVVGVLEQGGWRMPAAEPFRYRGTFAGFSWETAPRLLFVLKAMHALTGEPRWESMYEKALGDRGGDGPTRLAICEHGLESVERQVVWTGSVSTACLRGLWEMETDAQRRAAFARGLAATAEMAATVLPRCREFDNDGRSHFEPDWRKMNTLWREQRTEHEAVALAEEQLRWFGPQCPRRSEETRFVREPAFATWIVSLCPQKDVVARHRAAVLETIAHYRYDQLRYSQFFPVESAWWRLNGAG